MNHTVAVEEFEGPLGVLLDLINRDKLEVSNVSVGTITSAYLEKVRHLDDITAEDLSEFLQLGARLLYIKSLALLPQTAEAEQTRELEQLSLELAEYRRYQAAARYLASRTSLQTWSRPAAPRLGVSELPMPSLALNQLAEAFNRALKFALAAKPTAILSEHISIEVIAKELSRRLKEGFDLQSVIERCHNRLEIVVNFLALLELVRSGKARVVQVSQFEPIRVEAAYG
jgi:segregation and condensation protein A